MARGETIAAPPLSPVAAMQTLFLLSLITLFYAGYNLLVKVASDHAGPLAGQPVLATIALQLTALTVSVVYLGYLYGRGQAVGISPSAIPWAMAAGVCIGLAEILYFILFRGVAGEPLIPASRAIPFIVGGTIVVTVTVAGVLLGERMNAAQWCGVGLSVIGLLVLAVSSRA